MRLLLVEDSVRLRRTLALALRRAGYAVDVAGNGQEALLHLAESPFDAIVLDIMLPGIDGLNVLRRLREAGRQDHVLLLSARVTVADRVSGLRNGADDYLVKPFALDELLARVESLCRRAYTDKNVVLEVGALRLDTQARKVTLGGQAIELPAREYNLLEYLVRRRGQVVSRPEIEEHIYDEKVGPMSNVVDSAICVLRKKLLLGSHAPLIRTRRGHGYFIRGAVEGAAQNLQPTERDVG